MENYKILAQVGEGTYGRVFKAVDLRNNSVVALKQLFTLNQEEGVSYLALQEIKYLKFLRECKNIINLLDVFTDKDSHNKDVLCLAFNFVTADLTGLLSVPTYTPSLSHVKCLFKQLLEGLCEIHKRNLMHRDIKAANLLINHDGHLQLGDLGMMTSSKQHNEFSPNVVTLWYRAPELLLGAVKYGAEVDMWSAGIVFVELMTKKSPFPGYNEPYQLDLIFKLLGTPDNSTWPGVEELPGYKKIRKGLYKQNQLRRVFKDWDVEAIDFLEQFFAPPSKRITAEQALQHHFFTTEPLPCDPSELSGLLPSIHEFEVKRQQRRSTASDSAAAHSHGAPDNTKKRHLYNSQLPPQAVPHHNSSHYQHHPYPSASTGGHSSSGAPQPNYAAYPVPNKQMRYNNNSVQRPTQQQRHHYHQQPHQTASPPSYHMHQQQHHHSSHERSHSNNNDHHMRSSSTSHSGGSGVSHVMIPPQGNTTNFHLYHNYSRDNNTSSNNHSNVPVHERRKVVVPQRTLSKSSSSSSCSSPSNAHRPSTTSASSTPTSAITSEEAPSRLPSPRPLGSDSSEPEGSLTDSLSPPLSPQSLSVPQAVPQLAN